MQRGSRHPPLLVRARGIGLIGGAVLALSVAAGAAADELAGRLGPISLLGEGPNRLLIGAGVFDAFDESRYDLDGDRSPAANLDLRIGRKLFGFGPAAGVTANVNGGVFGYAGLYADLAVASFVVTPLIGAGAYRQGDSKDLGGTFAVRFELGIALQFANEARLGIRWGHVQRLRLRGEPHPGGVPHHLRLAVLSGGPAAGGT